MHYLGLDKFVDSDKKLLFIFPLGLLALLNNVLWQLPSWIS